jgi:cytochrome P450
VTIPAHVPAGLVRRIDLNSDPEVIADPWAAVDRIREDAPLLWSAEFGGYWIATSAELAREILQTPEAFVNTPIGIPALEAWPRKLIPLEVDGDEHTRYRRLLTPLFSPRAIRPLTDTVREHATRTITSFAGDDRVEFMSQLAFPLPSVVFLALFGIPVEQADTFLSWVHDVLHTGDPEIAAVGGAAIVGYLTQTIADRMRQPADDMISALTQMDVGGRPLTAEELLDIAYLLFVAGLDTVSGQLGVIMLHLARNPGQQRALRADPSLIGGAVEELVRLYTITPVTRTASRDYVLNGVQVKRGDRIYIGSSAANRDPAELGDPAEAKFDRERNWSAAFGLGPHRCLGMHLARQELRVVLELMTTLAPPFRLAPGATWQWHTGGVWGLDRLDLEFVRDADVTAGLRDADGPL